MYDLPRLRPATASETRAADGRDYEAEVEAAREEFYRLSAEAETLVMGDNPPSVVLDGLLNFMDQAERLRLTIPVKDYEANDFLPGQYLDREIVDFLIWAEEQFSKFRLNSSSPDLATRAVANVMAVPQVTTRYRAVVTRSITETAVVEFDSLPVGDTWALAKDLAGQIPESAWVAGTPCEPWVQSVDEVD